MSLQKRKILYLITLSEWGGAQKYITDLATFFAHQDNYQVAVAFGGTYNSELTKRLKQLHIKIYYLSHLQRSINFYHDLMAFWQIRSIYKEYHPNIVHLNSSKAGILGALATFGLRQTIKKVIYTVHGLILNEPLSHFKKIFYCLAECLGAKFKTDLICVSKFDKQSIIKHRISPPQKITVIHNGLNLSNNIFFDRTTARKKLSILIKLKSISDNYQLTDQDNIIGTIANFYPTKGLTFLIESAKIICQQNPQTRFIIIGDGPKRRQLTELINKYQLEDNVLLLGILDKAPQYLKAFDLFVLPSVKEGLPYALIEAQAAGLPTVATNVGGNPEIIQHNKNGLLVPPADSIALSNNILKLLNDKKLQQQFSQTSLIQANNFSLTTMLTKTKQVYEK